MDEIKKPIVIAIASISGGGKTTVVEKLNEELPNSEALYFDEYDLEGPEDVMDWMNRGANYNEWDLTPFVKDLAELLTKPLDYIVLDFPFSYQHAQTHSFISFSFFVDTPLDMALARRTIRDFQDSSTENIVEAMKHYNSHGRQAYLEMLYTIKPSADFIVDGSLPVAGIVNLIAENV
jgi:uridine kinase